MAFETSCVTTATNMEMGQMFGTREGEFSVGCEVGGGYPWEVKNWSLVLSWC